MGNEEARLAARFQQLRPRTVRRGCQLYRYLDYETIDGLYSECWFSIRTAHTIRDLPSYVETALINHIKNYIRDRMVSQDIFERFRQESEVDCTDDDGEVLSLLDAIPDTSQEDSAAHEEISQRVERVMDRLPRTVRIIGEWAYIDGLTEKEMSKRIGFGVRYIRKLTRRFRMLFRETYEQLQKHGE